jgi:hypothetical protein
MVGTRRTVYSSPDVHRHLRPAAVPGQARAKAYRLRLLRKDRRGCFVGPDIVTPISSPRETAVGCILCTVLLPHAIPGLCSQRLSEKGLSWRYGPGAGVPASAGVWPEPAEAGTPGALSGVSAQPACRVTDANYLFRQSLNIHQAVEGESRKTTSQPM